LYAPEWPRFRGGRSGRFESLKETAEEYAFILNTLGRRE